MELCVAFTGHTDQEWNSWFVLFTERGSAVTQSVEVLRYKSKGGGFDSRLCDWNFSLTCPHYGPGVDSASNNEYQEYFLRGKGGRCVGLTTLPPSFADCLDIWKLHLPGTLRACAGLYRDCFTFTFTFFLSTEGGQDKMGVNRRDYLKNLRINGSILLKCIALKEFRGYALGLLVYDSVPWWAPVKTVTRHQILQEAGKCFTR